MQTLTFTHWELQDLTCIYHELRNIRLSPDVCSTVIRNRTEKLFDKLRFAEFAERQPATLTPIAHPGGGL